MTHTMTPQLSDIINIYDNGVAETTLLSNKHDYSKQVTRYLPSDTTPHTNQTSAQINQNNTNERTHTTPVQPKTTIGPSKD